MLFDPQKLPINRKNIRRPLRSGRGQFAFSMRQDFFEVPRHYFNLTAASLSCYLAETDTARGHCGVVAKIGREERL
jgi:hypothetical protein